MSPESEGLANVIDQLLREIGKLETDLRENGGGANLAAQIGGFTGVPTADQLWQIDDSWEEVPPLINRLNDLITDEVPALYAELDDAGIRPNPGSAIQMQPQ